MNALDHFIKIRSEIDDCEIHNSTISGTLKIKESNLDSLKELSTLELIEERVFISKHGKNVQDLDSKDFGKEIIVSLLSQHLQRHNFYFFEFQEELINEFPVREPKCERYYIQEIEFDSGQYESIPLFVDKYKSIIKSFKILRLAADYDDSNSLISPQLIFITDKRLVMPISYNIGLFESLEIPEGFFDFFKEEIYLQHKRTILKNVLVNKLLNSGVYNFEEFMKLLPEIFFSSEKQFELFINEFSYEEFRRKFIDNTLDFSESVNKVVTNLEGKILVLPIGYILALSQVEIDGFLSIINVSIFLGLTVIWYLAWIFICNQKSSLSLIKTEFKGFLEEVRSKVKLDAQTKLTYIDPINERITNQEKVLRTISQTNHIVYFSSILLIIIYILTI